MRPSTGPPVRPSGPARAEEHLARAAGAARNAAAAATVRIRQLDGLDEFDESLRVYDAVWHTDGTNPPVGRDLLRALSASGSYVAGAFDEVGMLAASFAVFHPPGEQAMHSHIVGVAPRGQGRGVGFAMKLDQRSWALARGVTTITWTFDPLVRRNAHVNLGKLGADAVAYFPDFYGTMGDRLNGSGASDRLLVSWDLLAPVVSRACEGRRTPSAPAAGVVVGVGITADQRPVPGVLDAPVVGVAIPADVEDLRVREPALAAEWRLVVREALSGLLGSGGRVLGFDGERGYLVATGALSAASSPP